MEGKTLDIFHRSDCLNYSFGGIGLFDPRRTIMAFELMRDKGLFEHGLSLQKATKLKSRILSPYHSRAYVQAAENCCATGETNYEFGLNTPVMRLGKETCSSALSIVSSTLAAGLHTMETGRPSFSPYGGLHHARHDRAAGFCVFNDIAVTAATLAKKHGKRVSVLDLDLHHGDGTEEMLRNIPTVQTISIQGSDTPGLSGDRERNIYRYRILDGTGDNEYIDVLGKALYLVNEFKPDILIVQCGVDTYRDDALHSMQLSMRGFREIYHRIDVFAERILGGNVVYTGGGGYGYRFGAPRAWTLLAATVLGVEIDDGKLSEDWRDSAINNVASEIEKKNMPESLREKYLRESVKEIPRDIMD
jgi:acetoin utilization protein AcuC